MPTLLGMGLNLFGLKIEFGLLGEKIDMFTNRVVESYDPSTKWQLKQQISSRRLPVLGF